MKRHLQKFTEIETDKALDNLLKRIIKGKKISPNGLLQLTDKQREKIRTILTAGVVSLVGEDRQAFINNVEALLSEQTKHEIWEQNHNTITACIDYLTRKHGRFPTHTQIAVESGLSRVTVHKHLKDYYTSESYKEKKQQYTVLREKMLAKIYSLGIEGDVRAAKVFMDATEEKEPTTPNRIENQQNNFIQVNGTTITKEQVAQLPADQQAKLLEVLQYIQPGIATLKGGP